MDRHVHFLVSCLRGDKSRRLTTYTRTASRSKIQRWFSDVEALWAQGRRDECLSPTQQKWNSFSNVFRGTLVALRRLLEHFTARSLTYIKDSLWRTLLHSSMLCVSGIQEVIRCDDRIYIRHLASKSLANKKLKRVSERNYVNIFPALQKILFYPVIFLHRNFVSVLLFYYLHYSIVFLMEMNLVAKDGLPAWNFHHRYFCQIMQTVFFDAWKTWVTLTQWTHLPHSLFLSFSHINVKRCLIFQQISKTNSVKSPRFKTWVHPFFFFFFYL